MKLTDTMVDIVKMMMFSLFQIYETDRYYGRYCKDDDVPIIYSLYFRYMKLTNTMVDIVKMMMFQLFTLFISDI